MESYSKLLASQPGSALANRYAHGRLSTGRPTANASVRVAAAASPFHVLTAAIGRSLMKALARALLAPLRDVRLLGTSRTQRSRCDSNAIRWCSEWLGQRLEQTH